MITQPSRAAPAVTDLTRPFWDAAREGRLVIQRCADCRYYNHPPKDACDNCLSTNLTFEDVSGRGSVWSWTVMHQKSVAGFEDAVPYLTALVEVDEQPMLLLVTNLPGVTPGSFAIGDPVNVTFEDFGDGLRLPQFVLAYANPPLRPRRGGQGGEASP
jgi:hypothetical protein